MGQILSVFDRLIMPYLQAGILVETTYERYAAFTRRHLSENPYCTYVEIKEECTELEAARIYGECDMYRTLLQPEPGFGWATRQASAFMLPTLRVFLNPDRYPSYLNPSIHWLDFISQAEIIKDNGESGPNSIMFAANDS